MNLIQVTQDILPSPTSMQAIFGFFMGNQRPSHLDTVVATRHTVLAVCWLAINQSVRHSVLYTRPSLHGLVLVVGSRRSSESPKTTAILVRGGPGEAYSSWREV
jgi:hypothetical protein